MGLTRRTTTAGGDGGTATVTVTSITSALGAASEAQIQQVKGYLNISGFHYSGTGFYFYGDEIEKIDYTGKNIYQLDGGVDI